MKTHLEVGDLATADGLRVAHIVRDVNGLVARTLCKEIALWAALEADDGRVSRIAGPDHRVCKTCKVRGRAAVRRSSSRGGIA
jgi:hypothetical protein